MNNEYAEKVADNVADAANDIALDLWLLGKTTQPEDKAAIRNRIRKSLKYVEQGAAEIGSIIARHA